MKQSRYFLMIFAAALFTHCVTGPRIVDTAQLKDKPDAEREGTFKKNKISDGGIFTPYKIGEETYGAEALSPLFEAPYAVENTKDLYSAAKTWHATGTILGVAGAFMLGYNAGNALGGADTITGFWVGGGASLAVAFLFLSIADGKFQEASKLYNDDLFKALDLKQKTAAVKPLEQFPHYMLSLHHSF